MDEPWTVLGYETFDAMKQDLDKAKGQVTAKEAFIQTQASELGDARKVAEEVVTLKGELESLKAIQTPPAPISEPPAPPVEPPAPSGPTPEERLKVVSSKYDDRSKQALATFVETLSDENKTRIATDVEYKVELMEQLIATEKPASPLDSLFPELAKAEAKRNVADEVKNLFALSSRNAKTVIPTVKSNATVGLTADKTDKSIAETAPIVPKNGSFVEAIKASEGQGKTA